MTEKKVAIWKHIEFNNFWLDTDTSIFDELSESWFEKRKEFKEGNKEYTDFLNKLKRQHAIETGIIERLYDLSEGITQTFIKDGFIESFLIHGDTNISSHQLMGYLKSHFNAMDFVFDLVKNNRSLTKSFILELHQLILKHQQYTIARDSLGQTVNVALLKGKFKEQPNNPKRDDGTIFEYCPPLHVEAEMDSLLRIYSELEDKNTHPIIVAGWFHHAFTQIHPFQDGNGRIARLLASLILIRHKLFPFNVLRNEKTKYIQALENADNNTPNDLVRFFSLVQHRQTELALNIQTQPESLKEIATLFKEKIEKLSIKQKLERDRIIDEHRNNLFDKVYQIIGEIQKKLFETIPKEKAYIKTTSVKPEDRGNYYYTRSIIEYANEHDYFFNKNLPRGWFRLSFQINKEQSYDIIISIHHFGYFDSVVAIGSFIEVSDKTYDDSNNIKQTIPLNIKQYSLSLEKEITEITEKNIKDYLSDVIKVGMSIIINEMS